MTETISNTALNSELTPLWERVLSSLQERILPHNFDMWLRPISCLGIKDNHIALKAPNRFIKDWFVDNYLSIVVQELKQQTERDFFIDLAFDETAAEMAPVEPIEDVEQVLPSAPVTNGTQSSPKESADYELSDRYIFETFVVGPSNQLAHAAALAVAAMPASKYNPLFIYGGVGLGKTHLLCAIGHEILRREPSQRILYLSSERFMNEYINHLRTNRMEEFRSKYRDGCDVLLMDDIQFIAGKDRTQDEFFHTFNTLYDSHRQIVVTSDKYPHEIPDLEERLRTRFQWGLIADIQHPDLETRVAILKKKAETERIHLTDEIALFLATHIKSNVRELEGSLIRLAATASLKGTEITSTFAQETLKNFFSQASANLSVELVQKEVAAFFNLKLTDLKSPKRHKAVALPRQIAMYLSRKLTNCSFPEIGQRFGGKDHSTVISACRKIDVLLTKDLSIRTTVESLERQLQL